MSIAAVFLDTHNSQIDEMPIMIVNIGHVFVIFDETTQLGLPVTDFNFKHFDSKLDGF